MAHEVAVDKEAQTVIKGDPIFGVFCIKTSYTVGTYNHKLCIV